VVEPALKPGDSTLQLLGTLTPLIRRLGPAADPSRLKNLPTAAAAVWALYTGETSLQGYLWGWVGSKGLAWTVMRHQWGTTQMPITASMLGHEWGTV